MSTGTSGSNSNSGTGRFPQVRRHRIASIHNAINDGEYSQLHKLLLMPSTIRKGNNSIQTSRLTHSLYRESLPPAVSSSAAKNDYDAQLLWTPNYNDGKTACHCAAGNFVPTEWWGWILQIASSSTATTTTTSLDYQHRVHNETESLSQKKSNPFLYSINDFGESVVDTFFRTYINPSSWQKLQVRVRSHQLIMSMKRVVSIGKDVEIMSALHEKIRTQYYNYLQTCQNRYRTRMSTNSDNVNTNSSTNTSIRLLNVDSSTPHGSTSTATVQQEYDPLELGIRNTSLHSVDNDKATIHVTSFLINLHYLCHAIMRQQYPNIVSTDNNDTIDIHECSPINTVFTSNLYAPINMIDVLCYTGNCPSIVMKLLVTLFPMSVSNSSMNMGLENHAILLPASSIPIHRDVRNEIDPTQSTIACNTTMNSETASITSTILPLHNWCSSGCNQYKNQVCTMLPYLLSPGGTHNITINDESENNTDFTIAKQRAMTIDPRTGRLPLLTTVLHGKSIKQIQLLFDAAPEVLEDTTYNKLPIFAWAASASFPSSSYKADKNTIFTLSANVPFASLHTQENTKNNSYNVQSYEQQERILCRAKCNYANDDKLSIWRLATPSMQNDAIINAAKQIECEQLTTIYVLLKLCPIALQRAIEHCSA